MQSAYAAFLHDPPARPSANSIDLDQDDQVDSGGDDGQLDRDDDDDDNDYQDAPDEGDGEDDDEDDDGYALKEATVAAGSNPPTGQFAYPTDSQLPYPILATGYIPPRQHNPYFFTPPQHNPYSPTSGAGHLHPPAISRNPYPIAFTLPHPTTPSGEGQVPLATAGPGPSSTPILGTQYDPTDYINEDPSSSEGPPMKRARRTNANLEVDTQNRSAEELYVELPAPPLVDDPDPTAPPNSIPGRVLYPKYKCTMCDAKFPRKNAVVAHIKTHLGKRRYTCSHPGCNMAFVREHDCKRHEATHNGSRPHVCVCGRPFARPDALRRHKEKGHCGLSEAKSPKETSSAPFNLGTLPLDVDPTWTEGRPSLDLANVVGAAGQTPVTYTAEEVITLTRQLEAATAATSMSLPHVRDPQFAGGVDGHAVAGSSAAGNSKPRRAGRNSIANKGPKKSGPRAKRVKKSAVTVNDDDAMDVLDPASGAGGSARSTGENPNSPPAAAAAVAPAAAPPDTLGHPLGASPYNPSPTVAEVHRSQFLPYLHSLAPHNGSAPTAPQSHSTNPLVHARYPTSPNNFPPGFIQGQPSYPYHPDGYPLRPTADSTVQLRSLPIAVTAAMTGPGSFYTAGNDGGSAFPRAAPPTGSDSTTGFSQVEPNGSMTATSKVGGVSLVELAVDAATRAQQKRSEEQAQYQAQAERRHGQGSPSVVTATGSADRPAGPTQSDSMELDMGMDILHSAADAENGTANNGRRGLVDEDDIDGTDVGGEAPVPVFVPEEPKGKAAPRGAKAPTGKGKRGLRTRARTAASS